MEVRVRVEEISEGLRCDDHGGYGIVECGKVFPEELACRSVCDLGKLAVERAVKKERLSEQLRNREDELEVGNIGQDLLHHTLGPGDGALLSA